MEQSGTPPPDPGRRLRELRERLGLKYRDVLEATQKLAVSRRNQEFAVGLSRLADIENRGTIPSIFRLYSLSAVYGLSLNTLLSWYGVDVLKLPSDTANIIHSRTRLIEGEKPAKGVRAELLQPPGTVYVSRPMLETGPLPAALAKLQPGRRYAVVGSEDWSMYPLIHPGAFVQIDDRLRKPQMGPWASEAERPVYVVEMRDGYRCAWCSLRGRELALQYHPRSGLRPESLCMPDEGEIIGQVVGLAMRLDTIKGRRSRPGS